ncbi:argininosuccinate lyase [Acidipila sp. EB88]|uniref:argininosuccinate lyase n=1 Tax=Acidipila sp. EB88 TaxID=2305226 RepID=UPI000F5D98F9|nr:argininosuccinate lyase [Acidipila sp. EB88]RRA49750.1 argininosuccinate lyase [Acidipila sp. EB88]
MKMWSGRFREPLDSFFDTWQRSITFDRALLQQEVQASKAHARALAAAGVLDEQEQQQISSALDSIAARFSAAKAVEEIGVATGHDAEDIHHFVEMELVELVGNLGLKLHTGRSRNEQVATDLRLYIRESGAMLIRHLGRWANALLAQAVAAGEAAMPAYTHLQRAEPVLVAHWLLAYVEMILRDASRLEDCLERLNFCPLGSGAVAGATLALDRTITSETLRFAAPTANSMDATSDRDFVLEYLQVLTLLGVHVSRFAEEMTLFATAEFGFVELPEAYSTGSSAMPQKKNPDLTELLRAKVGRLSAAAQSVLLTLKGLPLAYNKDMQETQEPVFAATQVAHGMLHLLAGFTHAVRFKTDRMRVACEQGYLNAMAAATYLTEKGVPFRTAHERVGTAVRFGLESGRELQELSLQELQSIEPLFGADVYAAITLEATLDCHDVIGGTARARVRAALAETTQRVQALCSRFALVTEPHADLKEAAHAGT